jgi:hypothetical protein
MTLVFTGAGTVSRPDHAFEWLQTQPGYGMMRTNLAAFNGKSGQGARSAANMVILCMLRIDAPV